MDETKRVVLKNYPVDKLPEEIREQFNTEDEVVLTVEARRPRRNPRNISEILEATEGYRSLVEDPVERVRAIRDYSGRDELHAGIRRSRTS